MVSLIAKTPFEEGPTHIGAVLLTPIAEGRVTSIAPFQGQTEAVSRALEAAVGLPFPSAGTVGAKGDARIIWVGRGRAHLIGAPAPDLVGRAAVTDQSGAEAVLRVAGETAEDVLARLVPMDLRAAAFGSGATARTQIAHMTASVSRIDDTAFELRVMRSMAATLWHDVARAAHLLAERV